MDNRLARLEAELKFREAFFPCNPPVPGAGAQACWNATLAPRPEKAPVFDPIRSDPRFQNLLRRMNFPQL